MLLGQWDPCGLLNISGFPGGLVNPLWGGISNNKTLLLAKRIHNDAPYCSCRRVYSPRKLTSTWEGKIQLPAKKSTLASFPSLYFNESTIGFLFTLSESQEWHFKGHVYPLAIFLLHHHVLSSHKIRPDNEAINPAGKIDVLVLLPPSSGYGSGPAQCEQ